MAAAMQVQEGDKILPCTMCGLPIEVGQWEAHSSKGVYHVECWSHGKSMPVEDEDE